MNTADAARRWADTWKSAWEAQDTEAIVALYHADVLYLHPAVPHRQPATHRQCASTSTQAFSEEASVRVWIGAPIVDGDRVAIEWWAALVENGVETTLGGNIGPAL